MIIISNAYSDPLPQSAALRLASLCLWQVCSARGRGLPFKIVHARREGSAMLGRIERVYGSVRGCLECGWVVFLCCEHRVDA